MFTAFRAGRLDGFLLALMALPAGALVYRAATIPWVGVLYAASHAGFAYALPAVGMALLAIIIVLVVLGLLLRHGKDFFKVLLAFIARRRPVIAGVLALGYIFAAGSVLQQYLHDNSPQVIAGKAETQKMRIQYCEDMTREMAKLLNFKDVEDYVSKAHECCAETTQASSPSDECLKQHGLKPLH